jgi:hypothetical protein
MRTIKEINGFRLILNKRDFGLFPTRDEVIAYGWKLAGGKWIEE